MGNMFLIYNRENQDLVWSNKYGWTDDLQEADLFTQEERDTLNLPILGEWRLAGTP